MNTVAPQHAVTKSSSQPRQHRPVDRKTGRLFRIVKPAKQFATPPPAIRKARLDNLVLVPASLLPLKGKYQAIANDQAPGTILVVLPPGDSLPRRALERAATWMKAKGQAVRVLQSPLG